MILRMDWVLYIIAALFALFGAVCVLLVAIGLPGTWIMVAAALLIELFDWLWLTPPVDEFGAIGPTVTFGWPVLGVGLALALLGELLEFLGGAAGTKLGGGSARGMAGAIIGGIGGAILLTPLLPIPLIGTLIGALIGTFAGAVIGEITAEKAKSLRGSMVPAVGATIGRVVGTLGKGAVGVVMWIVLSAAAFWP
jgi:uncharacterized protein